MSPVMYIFSNLIWIAYGENTLNTSQKYFQCSNHSGIYSTNIWTNQEILDTYPNAKPVHSMSEFSKVWETR